MLRHDPNSPRIDMNKTKPTEIVSMIANCLMAIFAFGALWLSCNANQLTLKSVNDQRENNRQDSISRVAFASRDSIKTAKQLEAFNVSISQFNATNNGFMQYCVPVLDTFEVGKQISYKSVVKNVGGGIVELIGYWDTLFIQKSIPKPSAFDKIRLSFYEGYLLSPNQSTDTSKGKGQFHTQALFDAYNKGEMSLYYLVLIKYRVPTLNKIKVDKHILRYSPKDNDGWAIEVSVRQ